LSSIQCPFPLLYLLSFPTRRSSDLIKQCADFPLADHVVVVGAAGAGAGGLASGVLDQLADFLLERHLSDEFVDFLFGCGIGKTCASRGGPRSLFRRRG